MLRRKEMVLKASAVLSAVAAGLALQPFAQAKEIYEVKPGDNFYRIAVEHNITLDELLEANQMDGSTLLVGTNLVIPETNEPEVAPEVEQPAPQEVEETVQPQEENGFKTNAEAVEYAKSHFDWHQHREWRVEYEDGHFVVHFDPRINKPEPQPETNEQPEAKADHYTVQKGDSYYKIATQHGLTVDALKKANNATSTFLQIGDQLVIPGIEKPAPKPENKPTDTNGFRTLDAAVKYAKDNFDPAKHDEWYVDWKNGHYEVRYDMKKVVKPVEKPKPAPETGHYTVKKGDSYYKIATQHGLTVDALKKANNATSNFLQIGDQLVIPGVEKPAPKPENKPTDTNGFRTLNAAVKYAKDHFDPAKHDEWYVDWKNGHYEVRYDFR